MSLRDAGPTYWTPRSAKDTNKGTRRPASCSNGRVDLVDPPPHPLFLSRPASEPCRRLPRRCLPVVRKRLVVVDQKILDFLPCVRDKVYARRWSRGRYGSTLASPHKCDIPLATTCSVYACGHWTRRRLTTGHDITYLIYFRGHRRLPRAD